MIKFECPNCQRKLSVKDELAGKKGKCPGCKMGVVIPARSMGLPTPVPTSSSPEPLPQLPAPPRLDGPLRTQAEIDMEAMEALADEPPPEDAPPEVVTFECPMCGETVSLKADLAGKRAPCPNPECRRIIKVPEIERKTPVNWREVDRRPAGTRPVDQPAAEGAVDSQKKTTISAETAQEFGLSSKKAKPVPFIEKVFPYFYYGLMLLVASLLGLGIWARQYAGIEKALLASVEGYVKDSKANAALDRAAVYRGLGEYHFRRKAADSAAKGRAQCEAALGALAQTRESDRDTVLLDVALTLIDFSAGKKDPAVENGEKLDWDETQKELTTAIRSMSSASARREGLRIVGRRLIAANHPERALALAGLAITDAAERAEAQATIGLELLAATTPVKELADRAADLALKPYASKDGAPPVTEAVVALALLTGKTPPPAPPASLEAENEYVGKTAALARQGKVDEARARAGTAANSPLKFRCLLALAAVTADTEATDIESAAKMLEGPLRDNPNIAAWNVYRLVDLGLRAKMPPDRLRALAAQAKDPILRARATLLVLGRELSEAKDVKPVSPAEVEKQDATSLGRLLTIEILCRHNASMNSSWGNDIQGWKDAPKAFGAIGVLQGRHKKG